MLHGQSLGQPVKKVINFLYYYFFFISRTNLWTEKWFYVFTWKKCFVTFIFLHYMIIVLYSTIHCFFIFREIFRVFTFMLTLFIFFLCRKIFISLTTISSLFAFFFLWKILFPFKSFFSKPFFVFLIISN